jgi:putative transposase
MTSPPPASRPGHASLRRHRVSLANHLYLITFTTLGRRPIFLDHDAARTCARALTDGRLWTRSRLLAWVLMPDHWHGLLSLGIGDDLSVRIALLKANTARVLRRECDIAARVWAPSFHDHSLRDDGRELVDHARYIVLNPVRAGLVRRVGDYSYWDCVWV